jgi:flagellar biosynthesis protein FlhA
MKEERGWLKLFRGMSADWLLPAAAVATVFVMLVPVPSLVLDLLLALSLTASVLVLLTALNILKPVEFSVFPSLLLMLTLLRLSLNLASSRRILLHGSEGPAAAGKVIEAFGQFVVGGNYVVGFVLFLALIAIQYLVVSHGAVRTAEVTARFTLDAMPGKQMGIDADLNAGAINEEQARKRREAVAREAEFCGAMDGAARFSQRDSLATVLITAINIVAGFSIGVFQQGIPLQEAVKTYTVLTVGDGLATILPALLVSVAGGMVVTRAASGETLGADVGAQLLGSSRLLWIASGVLGGLALIPGLPKFSFLALAGGLGLLAFKRKSRDRQKGLDMSAAGTPGTKDSAPTPVTDPMDAILKLDELMLEMGLGLVPLVDAKQGGQLLGKIKALRKHLAAKLGFLVPPVHITDNLTLPERQYVVYLRGVEIARWDLRAGCLLAISSQPDAPRLPAVETKEPAFNTASYWIPPEMQAQALNAGYTVVDPVAALATHLGELIQRNANELLTRPETKRLIDRLGDSHPKLVEELVPKLLTLGELQKVLQQLLREQISIRDLGTILETLVEAAVTNKQPVALVEAVRQALGRGLIHPLLDEHGELRVVSLDASIEDECQRAAGLSSQPISAGTSQISVARRVLQGLRNLFGEQILSAPPVLLCSSPGRFHLRRMLEPLLPGVVVISPTEIPPMTPVQSLGIVR